MPARALGLLTCAVVVLGGCTGELEAWEWAEPGALGLDADALARWSDDVARRDTEALLVLVRGRKVVERYDWGSGPEALHYTASLAKSVVGGLALALLASDGRVSLDEPAARHLPRWRRDPQRRAITLRQLATHSSGLRDSGRPGDEAARWVEAFWALDRERTPMHVSLEDAPLGFPPGEGFGYSNPGFAVLSVVLARALREAASGEAGPRTLPEYLAERVFDPLGLGRDEWSLGYGRSFRIDGDETWAVWGGARMTPDALGRLGSVLLQGGSWRGRRVLPPDAVAALLEYAGTPVDPGGTWPAPSLGWWTNAAGTWPRLPPDAVLGWGLGHQILLVVPSLDLVVVRLGRRLDPQAHREDYWSPLYGILLAPLMDAFGAAPSPPSEAMRDRFSTSAYSVR